MKHALWWPFILLAGMALGSWPGRREADRLRRELEEMRVQVRRQRQEMGTLGQLTRMMRIPEPTARAEPPTGPSSAQNPPETPVTNRPARRRLPLAELRGRPGDERSLKERIEEAAETWRIRSEVARNNFVARAGFTAEEAAQFDVLVQAMNLRLRHQIEAFAEAVRAGEPVTPERGARLIRDLSAAVVLTYDEMDRTIPRWRSSETASLDLGQFIDPSVAEPLVGLEDVLRQAERGAEP